ncbi:MAG: hypothetical protein NC400_13410 [Clostridium sp.]|nr:hypothetical protein [Clostridium sp.]
MATDEEYLDNLLKSLNENEPPEKRMGADFEEENAALSAEETLPEEAVLPGENVSMKEEALSGENASVEKNVLPGEDALLKATTLQDEDTLLKEAVLSGEDTLLDEEALLADRMPPVGDSSAVEDALSAGNDLSFDGVKEESVALSEGKLSEEDVFPAGDDLSIEEILAADGDSAIEDISPEEILAAGEDLSMEDILAVGDESATEDMLLAEEALSAESDLSTEVGQAAEGSLLTEEELSTEDIFSAEGALPTEISLPTEEELSALPTEISLPTEEELSALSTESDFPIEEILPAEELLSAEGTLSDEDTLLAAENLENGALEETLAEAEANAENDVLGEELIDDPNLLQMLENMGDSDPDLEEINSLLNKANLNEGVDDDMLALLESAEENQNYGEGGEAFDIFAESELGEPSDINMGGKASGSRDGEGAKGKKKKAGFFAKIMALLTKEADELDSEPEKEADTNADLDLESDENARLLAELSGENKKKAPKKDKKEKKKAAKKDKKKEKPAAKKKEKPAKQKKPKEKKPAPPAQKPVKILNTKGLLAIIALCATLIASILILSMFLPQFAGRQEARMAFSDGNYKAVYELFYKKNLSSKEAEIYNKAKTVLRMERKLESYQNNMAMNRELEAVDALILGVKCYQGMYEADTYGVRQEVAAIYQQICGILESNYGISEEEAISITKYDDVAYTRRLRAIVGIEPTQTEDAQTNAANGGSSEAEDAEAEDAEAEDAAVEALEDVLPEEEDLVQ